MKILFVAPYIPNQIRVRPFHWLRSLVEHGHELTLLAVWSTPNELGDIEALQKIGVRVIAHRLPQWRSLANAAGAFFSDVPLQAVHSVEPELMRTLKVVLAEDRPDVVHIEHLRGAQYGLFALGANGTPLAQGTQPLPVVWDSVDCISHLFQQAAKFSRSLQGRMMTKLDLPRTQRYEGWLVHQFDHVLVTSQTDKAALVKLAMQSNLKHLSSDDDELCRHLEEKLSVLPNGVDLDYFAPNGACPESTRIVFTGKMSYHANVTAALHLVQVVMPQVWAKRPEAEVWIVGKDPVHAVRALASEGAPGHLQGRVVVTGSVPDIRPYLHQAAVAVAPIVYGAGIQNKVLEAMACATPVVVSRQAASALETLDGHDLLVADDASDMAAAIVSLLNNPQRRVELSRNGRTYVEQKHSWGLASTRLERLYSEAIEARRINL